MHKQMIPSTLLAASILLTATVPARADTITTYLTAAAFNAQAGAGLTAIPFDDQLPAGSSFGLNNQTFDVSGVSFHANGTAGVSALGLIRAPLGFGTDAYLDGGGTFNQTGPNSVATQDGTLYADLPAGVTAVAFQLGVAGSANIPLYVDAVTASGDHVQQVTFTQAFGPGAFVGFISDSPITQIQITGHATDLPPGGTANALLDNFTFGSAADAPAAAPLPASATAGGALLLLIGAADLRRRRTR